ncbi:MAG: F-box protein [Candidatus Paracaedibacteraceae bacterium]|nr:F-box protein [Candidatus Paracaedibacteraceae bacterium]
MFKKICLLFILSVSVFALEEDGTLHSTLKIPELQFPHHAYLNLNKKDLIQGNSTKPLELSSLKLIPTLFRGHYLHSNFYHATVEWEKFISSPSKEDNKFYKKWFKENFTSRLYVEGEKVPSYLEELPPEILINILRYLSLKDLGIVRQLDHYFNALSQDKWVWKQHISLTPKRYNSFYEEWFEENLDSTSALTIKKHKIEAIKNTSYTWQTGPFLEQSLKEIIPPFILVPLVAKLAYDKSSKEMLRTIAIHEPRLFITKESIKTLFAIILHADKFFVPSMPLSDQQFLLHKLAPLGPDYICSLARLIPQNAEIFFRKNKDDAHPQTSNKKESRFCKIHDHLTYTGLVHITIMLSQAQQFFIPDLKGAQRQELFNILSSLFVNQLMEMAAQADQIFIPETPELRQILILNTLNPLTREDQIRCSCRAQ